LIPHRVTINNYLSLGDDGFTVFKGGTAAQFDADHARELIPTSSSWPGWSRLVPAMTSDLSRRPFRRSP